MKDPMIRNIIQERESYDSIMENIIRDWFFEKITRSNHPLRVYTANESMIIRGELTAIIAAIHRKMNYLLFALAEGVHSIERDHANV